VRSFLPAVGWWSARSGDVDTLGGRITGLPAPVADSDAATKKYVDDNGGGGSQTLAEVLEEGGDPDGNPVTGRLVVEAPTHADGGFRVEATDVVAGDAIAKFVDSSAGLVLGMVTTTGLATVIIVETGFQGRVRFWNDYDNDSAPTFESAFGAANFYDSDGNYIFRAIQSGGILKMPGLPTEDPHVVNQLWNDSGVLSVSAG
jgi:hypothetical protein